MVTCLVGREAIAVKEVSSSQLSAVSTWHLALGTRHLALGTQTRFNFSRARLLPNAECECLIECQGVFRSCNAKLG